MVSPDEVDIMARRGHIWEGQQILRKFCSAEHLAWEYADRTSSWVGIGGVSGATLRQIRALAGLTRTPIVLVMLGSGGWGSVLARRGHLWEARQLLKQAATFGHF